DAEHVERDGEVIRASPGVGRVAHRSFGGVPEFGAAGRRPIGYCHEQCERETKDGEHTHGELLQKGASRPTTRILFGFRMASKQILYFLSLENMRRRH